MIRIFQPTGGGGGLTIGTTTITGGTTARLLFDAAGVVSETDGATWDATNKALTIGGATVTTSKPVLDLSQTWNAGAVAFTGIKLNITKAAAAAASMLMEIQLGSANRFSVREDGLLTGVGGILKTQDQMYATAGLKTDGYIVLNSTTGQCYFGTGTDTTLSYSAASVLWLSNNRSTGAAMRFTEMTAPSAPATNNVVLYAEDDGAGKTRLMARFPTGAAQQVAIEP